MYSTQFGGKFIQLTPPLPFGDADGMGDGMIGGVVSLTAVADQLKAL